MYRPCLGPDCPELVDAPATRCPDHARAQEVRRGSPAQRGYDARHRRLSAAHRRRVPFCEYHFPGCQLVAHDADHRVPVRAGGRSIASNYVSTCRSCHARKTREDAERWPL